ncbi:cysteine desulfurase-like protein [Salinibacillus xinjiangensis]|uniref:Cysteine desulfurase-like protein n=1 Tax=Salinibacillus xinjiangensis TaxID=1229268 RepID=A0A6G1X9D6_9BACI|nr:cysteine desulfurase-like protein [Salinibacillus xinjiangensis]MRG87623.1 cysteine desulfurase-like protein [Salinibacillus xinjiangensis]
MTKQFPIDHVRSKFPALKRTVGNATMVYFDGPGGTQMVDDAANAMFHYISNGMANLHGTFVTSVETDDLLDETRSAVADLIACKPNEVAFGPNMTTLAFSLSRALASSITEGDEIVLTELDHRANVDPWLSIAEEKGAKVRFIRLDPETYTLDLDEIDHVITENTKLVAVGMSSNVTGTVNDVETVIQRAIQVNAVTILDAVHAVPHIPIDFQALEADVLLCSAYKFFGPHVGIAVIRENLFKELPIYKLKPAPAEIPFKLETGTQNHEGIAGLFGAIQFLEQLGSGETRRDRIVSGVEAIQEYEDKLALELEEYLQAHPDITLYRAPDNTTRTPTLAFTLKNHHSRDVTKWFFEQYRMCIADGDFYASTMAEKLQVYPSDGWIRIGLAPYNTVDEVELFKEGMERYLARIVEEESSSL